MRRQSAESASDIGKSGRICRISFKKYYAGLPPITKSVLWRQCGRPQATDFFGESRPVFSCSAAARTAFRPSGRYLLIRSDAGLAAGVFALMSVSFVFHPVSGTLVRLSHEAAFLSCHRGNRHGV